MAKLTVNKRNRPQGAMIGVPGLGLFENGKTHEVSADRRKKFEAATGKKLPSVIGDPIKESSPPPVVESETSNDSNTSNTSNTSNDSKSDDSNTEVE